MAVSDEKKQMMLDRDQRAALRRELELLASGYTVGCIAFTREDIHGAAEQLGMIAEAMDALGWSEQLDTPDAQPFMVSSELATCARETAKSLAEALGDEIEPTDEELEDLAVLSTIGGGG
jgi:hypothetical protein